MPGPRPQPKRQKAIKTKKTLAAVVQSLPQELYDRIYELVFTPEKGERIIDKNYKPPAQLQVDSASRKRFADAYYGNGATFVFLNGLEEDWFLALPRSHMDQIVSIRCSLLFADRAAELHGSGYLCGSASVNSRFQVWLYEGQQFQRLIAVLLKLGYTASTSIQLPRLFGDHRSAVLRSGNGRSMRWSSKGLDDSCLFTRIDMSDGHALRE